MMTKLVNLIIVALLIFSICFNCSDTHSTNLIEIPITSDWQFSQADSSNWLPAKVPGCVHSDLLKNELIKDPYYRTNSNGLEWIDQKDWVYQTEFDVSQELLKKENILLVFECVDTYADIYLNDSLILSTDNYFLKWEVDCKTLLKLGGNQLRINFYSAIRKGLEILDQTDHPMKKLPTDEFLTGALNEKKQHTFTRKPGYQFGWDWTHKFVSVGLREPVYLQAWDQIKFENIHIIQQEMTDDLAKIRSVCEIQSNTNHKATINVVDQANQQVLANQEVELNKGLNTVEIPFEIKDPKLWWSHGLGDPHLYELSFDLSVDGKKIAQYEDRIGIRTVKLVREPDSLGTTFYFELNGVPVFMKGANYIPMDNFLDRVDDQKYHQMIRNAVDANMNMLRVWGGGIYEKDLFYDLCDENGLLVWQDFMFGGGIYPAEGRYLESVKEEVKQVAKRLRNHPCLALWCGNNEVYEALDHWGWDKEFSKEDYESIWQDYYLLFNEEIPNTLKKYDSATDYWPSSPLSDWDEVAQWDGFSGDIHYWEVWFLNAPFEKINIRHGRFNSEFGFQSFPEMRTIKEFSIEEDWDINSDVMAHRQKSYVGNKQIKTYMEMYFRYPSTFENFVYLSQVLQAYGIGKGIEIHRKKMPVCMGSLYWQLNDCWPAISWASLDYYQRWKALHYKVREVNKPTIVVPELLDDQVNIYVVSDQLDPQKASLNLRLIDFAGNQLWNNQLDITIEPNSSQIYFSIPKKELIEKNPQESIMLVAEIHNQDQKVDRGILYFERPKDLDLPDTQINIELVKDSSLYHLKIASDKLCKDLYLSLDQGEGFFSDNYFDLLPGETKEITLKVEPGQEIKHEQIKTISLKEGMQ